MKSSPWNLFVLFASCTTQIALATTISTFTDDKCRHPLKQLKGRNGYPSGSCAQLGEAGHYGSFKVTEEDPGCAVTIYQDGTEMCPMAGREIAPLESCFNSSWVYFSIDSCYGQPSLTASVPKTGAETASLSTSATTTAKTASSSNDKTNVGAIAGGVVGGVVGIALVLGVLWFLWRRRHSLQKGRRAELPVSDSHNALGLRMSELEAPKVIYEVPITETSPSELPESKALPELPEDRPLDHT